MDAILVEGRRNGLLSEEIAKMITAATTVAVSGNACRDRVKRLTVGLAGDSQEKQIQWTPDVDRIIIDATLAGADRTEIRRRLHAELDIQPLDQFLAQRQTMLRRTGKLPYAPPPPERRVVAKSVDPGGQLAGRQAAAASHLRLALLLYSINPSRHYWRLVAAQAEAAHDWRQPWPPKERKSE